MGHVEQNKLIRETDEKYHEITVHFVLIYQIIVPFEVVLSRLVSSCSFAPSSHLGASLSIAVGFALVAASESLFVYSEAEREKWGR